MCSQVRSPSSVYTQYNPRDCRCNHLRVALFADFAISASIQSFFLTPNTLKEGIQLPHDVVGSHDTLRHGLPAFKNDILTVHPGELDDFGFGDFLNDPKESDTHIPVDMHEGMEVRLGLSKGPVSRSSSEMT